MQIPKFHDRKSLVVGAIAGMSIIFFAIMDYYFPNNKINYKFNIKENLSVAELQNMVLKNYNVKQIVEEINA